MSHGQDGNHNTTTTLEDIGAGFSVANDTPDEKTTEEEQSLQAEAARAQKLTNDGHEQDLKQRKEYANKIFY